MDLAVVLMLLAYMVMSWRLVCRFTVAKGGKRWVGHGLGAIFGPLLGTLAALPIVPGKDEPATVAHLLTGSLILAAFLFAEYRTKQSWTPPLKLRTAKSKKQDSTSESAPSAAVKAAETRSRDRLSFSLRDTAELILADDVVDQREAELLLSLLDKQDILNFDPACRELHQVLVASLEDGVLDNDEAEEIKVLLSEICDRPIERPVKPAPKKKKIPKKPKLSATKKAAKTKAKGSEKTRLPATGEVLAFSYTDSKGDTSDRHISYRGSSRKDGLIYVKGICHDRQAFRTFRADRMDFICFAETGEMVDAFRV